MRRVMVTGGSGFIGSAVCLQLWSQGVNVEAVIRKKSRYFPYPISVVDDLATSSGIDCLDSSLCASDVVIHLASRAHVAKEDLSEPINEYRRINTNVTLKLARQAAHAGAKRFIFISSIGVNGNTNTYPFTAEDQPNPAEPYALSKWEAEQGLWQIQQETGMEVVIIRPPLVYGLGAPGNFGSLVRWVEKGVPLPLGAVHNKRSLVGIDNLVDLIIRCIDHPAAANQVFLAGDGEDLSTTELLRGVGEAMGKPARLIPVPAGILQFGATVLGKKAMAQRLLGSLQVDISKTCEMLDWKPPYTVQEGLRRCFERSN
ncbi:UDP-glucose 4-epimerase family protein [Stutzerimonas stutzeri]|uniref:UDP-glucose 4-epimerase family protein n=1 Tax=Stutzerimonas stutzeri TaxID=316 RepID=UPI0009B73379|nr:SDR family oxidoreductase [Stutzerimonas stutzeri]